MRIFKYTFEIAYTQNLLLPHGYTVLDVGLDPRGQPAIWASVDEDNLSSDVTVHVIGTGDYTPPHATHIGSFVQGQFVWHVFTSS